MDNPDADFRRQAASTRQLAQETTDAEMVALLLRLAEAYEEMAARNWRRPALRAGQMHGGQGGLRPRL
jgi:hypothetical protein